MLERRLVHELVEAGFSTASLRVSSVGFRRLQVEDLTATHPRGRLGLRDATVRYDPWMLFGARVKSLHIDGLQVHLDLESTRPKEETPIMDFPALEERLLETQPLFPMRLFVADNAHLRLQRNGRELVLPFSMALTNDIATEQIRATVQLEDPVSLFEGWLDRRDGLRLTAGMRLTEDRLSWAKMILPESLHPGVDGLAPTTANLKLDARWNAGLVGMINLQGDVDDGPLAGAQLQIEAMATNWTQAGPNIVGSFHVAGIRLDEFEPPLAWTANQSCRVSGGLSATGRFAWDQTDGLDLWPELMIALEQVEMVDLGVSLQGIHGVLSGAPSDLTDADRTNLLHVDLIRYGAFGITNLTLRLERLNRSLFEFELVDAIALDGHLGVPPFRWEWGSQDLEAVLEAEQINLAALAELLPRFDGSITGRLNGRVPVRFRAGRFALGSSTLRLDRRHPARLRYTAEGLLTQGAVPGSERHRQLELIEEALEDLRLEELAVDLYPPDQPQTPVRLRLEGTFRSPKAIIPVNFNLNLNGDLEEVARLLSRGEIELTL
jgi:hypothetical protein